MTCCQGGARHSLYPHCKQLQVTTGTRDPEYIVVPAGPSSVTGALFPKVVIKTQTEFPLSSSDPAKSFPDLEAQKLSGGDAEEGRRVMYPPVPRIWEGRLWT